MEGKKWYYNFIKRHPNLSLRQPESTSMTRVKGFCEEIFNHFFYILKTICDENQLDATRIYNVNESRFSTVQKKCQKVIAVKGKRKVGSVASGERGVNTILAACVSASGTSVPPMIILRESEESNLKNGSPPGSIIEASETEYMNSDLFVTWLKHFVACFRPNPEKKVLLALNGHTAHSSNPEALYLASRSGIIFLQLPSHTTHTPQPLDISVFGAVESY
jgi:hypothetical protein